MHIELSASRLDEISKIVTKETFLSNRLSPLQRYRLICRRRGIETIHSPGLTTGFTYLHDEKRVIALPNRLSERHLNFVAFHELGHVFLGSDATEHEADLFSYLSLKPPID
jgi:Zn-dependent peptidase ImmA (M78 family)